MFGSSLGSLNEDVLNASPDSPPEALKLIEEIKHRAKAALGMKNYPEAVKLYSKAIEVCPPAEANAVAILFANRSMCYMSMGNFDHALSDSTESIKSDPTYTKAYYRKSTALIAASQLDAAKQVILKGLELKPEDKDFIAQLKIVESRLAEDSLSTSAAPSVTRKTEHSPAATRSPASATSSAKSSAKDQKVEESSTINEDEEIKISDNLRGYKKTKEGKITTFFNNELDEHTKALIGDIAPKKLEGGTSSERMPAVGSVWNSAGTFEAVDQSAWALERIKQLVGGISPKLLRHAGDITIKETSVEGDAQITAMRGKRKHICDATVELTWVLTTVDEEYEGQTEVQDVTSDREYEFQTRAPKPSWPNVALRDDATSAIEKAVRNALNAFFDEFTSK